MTPFNTKNLKDAVRLTDVCEIDLQKITVKEVVYAEPVSEGYIPLLVYKDDGIDLVKIQKIQNMLNQVWPCILVQVGISKNKSVALFVYETVAF